MEKVTYLEGYGVRLRRITEGDIEKLRCWRNDPKIQQYMEYRDYITPEMQQAWFKRVNNENNYYFIIEYQSEDVGMINVRDIDYEEGIGEPGIFIYDDKYIDTDVPTRASFCLGDFIWDTLKLKKEVIHVLCTNKRAIRYNLSLGFRLSENQENVLNQEYTLSSYEAKQNIKIQKIKKLLSKNI